MVNAKDGARKIMASSEGGDDEQSQMFAIFCVHVYTRTCLVPKSHMEKVKHGRDHDITVSS